MRETAGTYQRASALQWNLVAALLRISRRNPVAVLLGVLRWYVPLLLLVLPGCAQSQQQLSAPSIQLVESVPEETALDHPAISNTLEVWIEMLRSARQSIDIEQFYIANSRDGALEAVIREVEAAAARGVSVRVITEKKFASVYPETLERLGNDSRITLRTIDINAILGDGIQHAKFFIVDEFDVFVGSQNWDWRALAHINELGLRVRDSISARAFVTLFDYDWALAGGADPATAAATAGAMSDAFPLTISDRNGVHEITPVFSPRLLLPDGARWDADALAERIDRARDSVKLQVLSYGSYPLLEDALLRAAARGVHVSVLVSDWSLSSSKQKDLKRLQRTEGVTVKFTVIPEHSSGFISFARVEHCKYLLVDEADAWIGTNNWSPEYFLASRNAGFMLHSPSLCTVLLEKFAMSWDGPYAATIDPEIKYTARKRDDGGGK
ncbi:MAG: phospholipase D-like domain-containing protein [Bacteroidota bacterium]